MRSFSIPLLLLAALSSAQAQASVPAPLNGIWKLTSFSPLPAGRAGFGSPEMVISGNSVRGRLGCGSYSGTIEASGHRVRIRVTPQPPKANVRCLYALPGDFHGGLNAASRYVISSDTRQLILFSKTARLTFERAGYVTPARK